MLLTNLWNTNLTNINSFEKDFMQISCIKIEFGMYNFVLELWGGLYTWSEDYRSS